MELDPSIPGLQTPLPAHPILFTPPLGILEPVAPGPASRYNHRMQRLLDYLKQHRRRFLDELCEYLRFPSVSAQPAHRKDLAQCARWLERHCRGMGLQAKLRPTSGNPVLLASTPKVKGSGKPHYIVYGHYDVQPADPFDLWKTPPFEPRIQGRSLIARGASDNKGQHFAHLKAVEAFLKTGTDLPCDITFLIEGEEEVGSDNLPRFLTQNRALLKGDGVVVSDNGMPGLNQPSLTYALRGVVAMEIELRGPNRDLHSGIYGGAVDNPAMVLCQLLARLRDARGKIKIPGFYAKVRPLKAFERKQVSQGRETDASLARFLGVPKLFGEAGYNHVEQRTARPTLEINGLTSGYQGDGSKTIVPSWARAKLTFRIVPDQDPKEIVALVQRHLQRVCPPTVTFHLEPGHAGNAYQVAPDGPQAQAALRALRTAFGTKPALKREGGSIPIVEDFKRRLGMDTLLLGLALPDDNPHSPNEKFNLDCFETGMAMSAHLWRELAGCGPR